MDSNRIKILRLKKNFKNSQIQSASFPPLSKDGKTETSWFIQFSVPQSKYLPATNGSFFPKVNQVFLASESDAGGGRWNALTIFCIHAGYDFFFSFLSVVVSFCCWYSSSSVPFRRWCLRWPWWRRRYTSPCGGWCTVFPDRVVLPSDLVTLLCCLKYKSSGTADSFLKETGSRTPFRPWKANRCVTTAYKHQKLYWTLDSGEDLSRF